MTTARASAVLQHIRELSSRPTSTTDDHRLLERFTASRDEAAFEALVRRHGSMVLGVCRRVLHNAHDAEDAFQATFLVLAQKAGSIRERDSIGGWLYRVGYHMALKSRQQAAARRQRETRPARPEEPDPLAEITGRELLAVLDEQLQGLPEGERVALVLCYLEGKTCDAAAREAGCSESTLKRRLKRGKERMRTRLARRGVTLPAALLAAGLASSAKAAVPSPLTAVVVKASLLAAQGKVAAGGGAHAAALADGAIRAMTVSKIKTIGAFLLAVTLLGVGTGLVASKPQPAVTPSAEQPPRPAAAAVPKPTDKNTKANEGLDDARSLQGEWQAVDGEKGGKPIAEDPTDLRIIFKGDEITIFGDGKKKYRLDTGKSPRELHIDFLDDKQKRQTIRMIYSLEKGELKLCMPLGPESARPTEFKTKAGSGLLLLVLRRVPKGAAGVKRPDDLANIKREWHRADAAPDGNYKLSYVWGIYEETCCLIKLETKDATQSVSLVDTDKSDPVTAVHTEIPAISPSSALTGQAPAKGVHVRLVFTTPSDDLVFDGSFSPPSLQARGYLEQGGKVFPATLTATDLTKLKFTVRDLPATPLQKALVLGRIVSATRKRAEFGKDAAEKAGLVKKAALAEKEALAGAPKLFREGFEKDTDDPLIFDAAVEAARFATRYQIPADQLRAMIAKADKTAGTYGRGWQREFNLQIAAALAPQKDFAALALDIATRLEKELVPADAAVTRQRVLKALAAAEANAGSSAAVQETLARLLAKVEETLDGEYRAKVPPFKPVAFTGRKTERDRAVVVELFTGTQCPPCVAAAVAFDALHKTYRPAELVLVQYHLHIPGPDPLTNADSEARMAYYAKKFPHEAWGVPTTFFNGKPEAGGGGQMTQAEEKYKQYRQVIDPLLETKSAAKLSASAVKQGNKVSIKVEVTDLQKPSRAVRLRLLLVEETVRYVGGNRVRFHHHVVRGMVGGADGFALNDKDSKHTAAVDLEVLRKSLNSYLADYNRNWRPFPNGDRPLDLSNLRLIALVQDDVTREIIQAAEVKIIAQGKTATKE